MTMTEVRPPAPAPSAPEPGRSRRLGERSASASFQVILAAWALVSVLPLIWAVLTALKPNPEVFASPWRLPSRWDFGNFVRAWGAASIGQFFLNTIIVVTGALVLTMLLSTMVAYVLGR